jgi:proteasome beta subunit
MAQREIIVPGAASVAVKCKDGVVLGNDRRATWGYTVTNKSTKKVFPLSDHIGISCYGLIGDFQILVKIMQARARLYEFDFGSRITTKAMGKVVSNYLYSRKMFPLYTNVVIAGVDPDGPKLYTLDAIGSLMPDDYGAGGTSMLMMIGMLEAEYKDNMTISAGEKLVEKAISAALQRDAMSGNGMDILTITDAGYKEKFVEIQGIGE